MLFAIERVGDPEDGEQQDRVQQSGLPCPVRQEPSDRQVQASCGDRDEQAGEDHEADRPAERDLSDLLLGVGEPTLRHVAGGRAEDAHDQPTAEAHDEEPRDPPGGEDAGHPSQAIGQGSTDGFVRPAVIGRGSLGHHREVRSSNCQHDRRGNPSQADHDQHDVRCAHLFFPFRREFAMGEAVRRTRDGSSDSAASEAIDRRAGSPPSTAMPADHGRMTS